MILIEIKGRSKKIPSDWNETTAHQVKTYLDFYYLKRDNIYGTSEDGKQIIKDGELYSRALIALLYVTMGIRFKSFSRINAQEMNRLIFDEKLVDFYFNGPLLSVNKYPFLTKWFKKLYGPVKFWHLTFEEFSYAEAFYHQYKSNNDALALDMFIAVLYRQSGSRKRITPDVDCREPFIPEIVESRLKFAGKIPFLNKMCVLLWYEHGRLSLSKEFDRAFRSAEAETRSVFDPTSWEKVVNALSQNNPAQFKNIAEQSVVRIFSSIQAIIIQSEELKRKINNQ